MLVVSFFRKSTFVIIPFAHISKELEVNRGFYKSKTMV